MNVLVAGKCIVPNCPNEALLFCDAHKDVLVCAHCGTITDGELPFKCKGCGWDDARFEQHYREQDAWIAAQERR